MLNIYCRDKTQSNVDTVGYLHTKQGWFWLNHQTGWENIVKDNFGDYSLDNTM